MDRELRWAMDPGGWWQVAPRGDFPHPSGITQVLDDEALSAIAAAFQAAAAQPNFPGLLIDYDHESSDPDGRTEAAGWIVALESRPDGLWAQARWSDAGLAALNGGRYRLVSPVFDQVVFLPNGRVRPLRLQRCALTNDPNLRGCAPLSNRSGTAPAPAQNQNQNQTKGQTMTKIITALGLPAGSDEDAVVAALTELKNRAARASQQAAELLADQVEADLDKFASRYAPDKRPGWKKALLANRADALALLESIPAPAAQPPLHNRAAAPIPANAPADFPAAVAALVAGGKTRGQAVDAAIATHPDLHKAWLKAGGAATV